MSAREPMFKLGAASRRRLEQLRLAGDSAPDYASMMVRAEAPLSSEQIRALEADGAVIRTHAGTVVTLDVPLAAVERIVAHDFIVAAELSSPLYSD